MCGAVSPFPTRLLGMVLMHKASLVFTIFLKISYVQMELCPFSTDPFSFRLHSHSHLFEADKHPLLWQQKLDFYKTPYRLDAESLWKVARVLSQHGVTVLVLPSLTN
jgi:hypothetical protein